MLFVLRELRSSKEQFHKSVKKILHQYLLDKVQMEKNVYLFKISFGIYSLILIYHITGVFSVQYDCNKYHLTHV